MNKKEIFDILNKEIDLNILLLFMVICIYVFIFYICLIDSNNNNDDKYNQCIKNNTENCLNSQTLPSEQKICIDMWRDICYSKFR